MRRALGPLGLAILLLVVAACEKSETAGEHIARADQNIANSEYKSAVIELKNALKMDNKSSEARLMLGKAYLALGDVVSAEKELLRALDLGSSRNDVLPALAEALQAQGKYAEVRQLDGSTLQPQGEATVLAMQALAALGTGDNRVALQLAEIALEKAPGDPQARLAKARILVSNGDYTAAENELQLLLATDPENAGAWSLTGDMHLAQRRFDEALVAYDKAVEYEPANYTVLFKRGLLNLQSGNQQAAQADATELMRLQPGRPGANYIQGVIHFQSGQYPEAIAKLSAAEPAFRKFPLVLYFLASAQFLEGNVDQAATFAARFNSAAPKHIGGRKLLAMIYLRQKNYAKAQQVLRPVLDANPGDTDALSLMSNILLRDGRADEGITLLYRLAALQPDSPIAQVKLGAGLLIGGQGDESTQHMEAALQLEPEYQQADLLLVINHAQQGNYDAAIAAGESFKKRNLTSTTPLNLLGRVYQAAGKPDEARQSFEQALYLDAGDPAANRSLAQMAVDQGDYVLARRHYTSILEHYDDYLAALMQLALLDVREGDQEAFVARLEQAMRAHPTAIEPRLLMGRYQISQGRADKVPPLFSSLEEAQKSSEQVLQLLALAQLSQKEHGGALFTLEQLIESTPGTASYHHMMALAVAGTGDIERTERELQRALQIDENYFPSRIALARLALERGQDEKFGDQVALLTVQVPENPNVLILRALYTARQGDSAAAVKLAEQAFQRAPNAATLLAAASYKKHAGDQEGALRLYRDWVERHPDDVMVLMALANSLQTLLQEREAAIYFEKIIQFDPDHVVALNNLAWYNRDKNPVRALEYVRRANKLAPNSADVLDTMAVVEYANKDYKQAQITIRNALVRSPRNPTMRYHSAMISVALNESDSAIATLEKLLREEPDFPERDQADKLLMSLKKQG